MAKPPLVPPGLTILATKLKSGCRLRPVLESHEHGGSVPRRPISRLPRVDVVPGEVERAHRAQALVRLERDAAISLLLEAPAECSERTPLPGACGRCWTCRIDKFLRDAGLRR